MGRQTENYFIEEVKLLQFQTKKKVSNFFNGAPILERVFTYPLFCGTYDDHIQVVNLMFCQNIEYKGLKKTKICFIYLCYKYSFLKEMTI